MPISHVREMWRNFTKKNSILNFFFFFKKKEKEKGKTLDLKLEGFNWRTGEEGPYSASQRLNAMKINTDMTTALLFFLILVRYLSLSLLWINELHTHTHTHTLIRDSKSKRREKTETSLWFFCWVELRVFTNQRLTPQLLVKMPYFRCSDWVRSVKILISCHVFK